MLRKVGKNESGGTTTNALFSTDRRRATATKQALKERFQNVASDVGQRMKHREGQIRAAVQRRRENRQLRKHQERLESLQISTELANLTFQQQQKEQEIISGYTLLDHMEYLHLRQDSAGNYYSEVSHLLCESLIPGLVKDYCHAMTEEDLEKSYYGIHEVGMGTMRLPGSSKGGSPGKSYAGKDRHLAVRTMTMRLSPDIMSNIVLDAVYEACQGQAETVTCSVLKRLQGHLQCLMVPNEDSESIPYLLDVRVCTKKTGELDRVLVLRIFPAEHHAGKSNHKPRILPMKNSERLEVGDLMLSPSLSQDLTVPMNLHLRGASSFLQYLTLHQRSESQLDPARIACPKESPKASAVFFLANYESCPRSVMVANHLHSHREIFPALNNQDWSLLQSSWTLISDIWRHLTEHFCLFHTFSIPQDKSGPPVILDLHYCSQVRQIVRDMLLQELEGNLVELRQNLENMEASHRIFQRVLDQAYRHYSMSSASQPPLPSPPGLDKTPLHIPPVGYVKLAERVCKCVQRDESKSAFDICNDAVSKVYKTFTSQDDQIGRKYLKEANGLVMQRFVRLREVQHARFKELESSSNTQLATRSFMELARRVTNSTGRVDENILARVPLLELDLVGGSKCLITATNLLITQQSKVFGGKGSGGGENIPSSILVDIAGIQLESIASNCFTVVSNHNAKVKEDIAKLHISSNENETTPDLILLVKTLQTHHDASLAEENYYGVPTVVTS